MEKHVSPNAGTIQILKQIKLVVFDFDGVFTDNMVYVSENGEEAVRCSRSDGLGLQKLRKLGIEMCIISTEVNPVVSARSRKLKLRCIQGCEDNSATLKTLMEELGISPDQVAFVGNDINDLSCLTTVGFPIVVQDAHPDVIFHALYRTKTPGGHGAVREVCDLFESALTSRE